MGAVVMFTFDERDQDIVNRAATAMKDIPGPRVGDWVDFADGEQRRISQVWPEGVQTSKGGSWHLGDKYGCSFSGSLYRSVPTTSLTLTDQVRYGSVWIFHHGLAGAGRGVHTRITFRVYRCDLPAPA